MKKMFCIECGKNAAAENFCDDCFLKNHELFRIENLHLKICDCGSYFDKAWIKSNLEDIIKSKIKSQNKIENVKIATKEVGNKIYAEITCSGYIEPSKKKKVETKKIIIILKKNKCDYCVKLSGGYYEALVQIRGKEKEEILKKFFKLVPKKSIVSIEEIKEGYDVKIMTKNTLSDMKEKLKGYEIKQSFKHVTTKKGRKIYRNFYSIR